MNNQGPAVNPNDEILMTKECPKFECSKCASGVARAVRHLGIESFFRHSVLGIRHSPALSAFLVICLTLSPGLGILNSHAAGFGFMQQKPLSFSALNLLSPGITR